MVVLMAKSHAKPGQIVDLRPFRPKLRDAKTTALIKEEHFEAIRLIVHAGAEIPPHDVAGNIMPHCLESQIVLGLATSEITLARGDWLYLKAGELHSLKGIVDGEVRCRVVGG